MAAVLGVGIGVLYAEDPDERLALAAITNKAQEYADHRDRNLAIAISNQVAKLFKT